LNEKKQAVRILLTLAYLWRRKHWLALGTVAATVAGVIYASFAPQVFVAKAVIYPKEISANTEKPLLGGGLAALSPLMGTSHLNRVEILLNSRALSAQAILGNDLLPLLFPERWDSGQKKWSGGKPSIDEGVGVLQGKLSTKVDVYKMVVEVAVRADDPRRALRILKAYLKALNERLKEGVVRDAVANKNFLEGQLARTYDPSTKEKIQQLIINQVETTMLLNANAFEVLDGPEAPPGRESPKRKRVVLTAALLGFILSVFALLALRAANALRADMRADAARSP
jgi:uncharacterized protein involved in exopolysaccharide biosynthesis